MSASPSKLITKSFLLHFKAVKRKGNSKEGSMDAQEQAVPAEGGAGAVAVASSAPAVPAAPAPDIIGPDEVLSLPPPPSHPDMDDDSLQRARTGSSSTSNSSASSTASKASSAAFSLAAAAKSRLAQGGRMMLSPLVHSGSGSFSGKSAGEKAASSSEHAPSSATASSAPALAAPTSSGSFSAPLSASSISYGIAAIPGAAASLGSLLFSSPASTSSTASTTATTIPSNTSPTLDASEAAAIAAANEAAAIVAAEEFRQVSAQQRMQILEDLVQSRRSDWSYLKAMHEGTNYWLNIALLREQQVLAHLGEKQTIRRSVQFFYLGLGLGRLISEFNHPQFLAMEGCQLLEELEFYFSSATVQGMKLMVATSSTLHEPVDKYSSKNGAAAVDDDESDSRYSLHEPFRPTIYKWNQRPVFRRLVTPPIPFPLDYREVMLSLCDILAIIYSKLVEDNSSSENINLFQAIVRFDERIKKMVIDPVKKEFSVVALKVMADEMASVRKMYGSSSTESVASPPPPSATAAAGGPSAAVLSPQPATSASS